MLFRVARVSSLGVPKARPEAVKRAEDFGFAVRIATMRSIGGEQTETWYGDNLQWPEDPYEGGHPFILRPAVRMDFFGRTVLSELEIPIKDLILIMKPVAAPSDWQYSSDSRDRPEILGRKYCRINAYDGFEAGYMVTNAKYTWFTGLREDCRSETILWGYGQATVFLHSTMVREWDNGRFFEIWASTTEGKYGPWGKMQ